MVKLANEPQTTTPEPDPPAADPNPPQMTTPEPDPPQMTTDPESEIHRSPSSIEADLLGDLGADDIDGEIEAADPRVARLDKDQFFMLFRSGVGAPNLILKPPLRSLSISENDQAARAASDAIYDTAAEIPALRFLIEPGNVWVQRAFVVGAFGYGVYASCMAEIRAREPADPPKQMRQADAPPANDNPPPAADREPGVDQGVKKLKVSHSP
jgi:hypothetical protein